MLRRTTAHTVVGIMGVQIAHQTRKTNVAATAANQNRLFVSHH